MPADFVEHTLPPVWTPDAETLLLGTMPSPQSRARGLYYGHPQNRFWPALCAVFGEPARPQTLDECRAFAARHRLALWDVLASCEIAGASDASIRRPVPNDIAALLAKTRITRIFTTGTTAYRLYERLCRPQTGIPAVCLPSPSPANCRLAFPALVDAYAVLAAPQSPDRLAGTRAPAKF